MFPEESKINAMATAGSAGSCYEIIIKTKESKENEMHYKYLFQISAVPCHLVNITQDWLRNDSSWYNCVSKRMVKKFTFTQNESAF